MPARKLPKSTSPSPATTSASLSTENRSWQEEIQDEKREEKEEEEEILLARENLVNWNVSRFRRMSVGFTDDNWRLSLSLSFLSFSFFSRFPARSLSLFPHLLVTVVRDRPLAPRDIYSRDPCEGDERPGQRNETSPKVRGHRGPISAMPGI